MAYEGLLLAKHVRAVAVVKRPRPAARDLVDLSDHRHRRLVSRAVERGQPLTFVVGSFKPLQIRGAENTKRAKVGARVFNHGYHG